MFATIAGPYPALPGEPEAALDIVLADQLDAGLGLVGEGIVRATEDDEAIGAAVRAWTPAAARVAVLADERDLPAPPVKPCLVGPLSLPGSVEPSPSPDVAITRVRAAITSLLDAGAPLVQID